MKRLIASLKWLDDNIVAILLFFFLFFVPLYPKFPLRVINYTYVAIRLEDFYVMFLVFVFFVQVLRKKVLFRSRFLLLFLLFWLAAVASFYVGSYFQKTIVLEHLGFLNAVRRIEYMIIFFIAASTIRNRKMFWLYCIGFLVVVALVSAYGLGQKFFGFPAIQTMNAEYARGHILYLTPEVRISSTFAGHYDLAAYLAFAFPFILGVWAFRNKLYHQILCLLLFILAFAAFLYTSSRISFIAYVGSIFAFLLLYRKWKLFLLILFITIVGVTTTGDLTDRFLKTLQIKQILINEQTGEVFIPQKITTKELPAGSFYVKIPERIPAPVALPVTPVSPSATATITAELSDLRVNLMQKAIIEKELKLGRTLNMKEIEDIQASLSALLKPFRTVLSDISFATRLQVEWPRAIAAFRKYPLFGMGPSSITEATDNDFLRWLGEFGIVGTVLFLTILFALAGYIWQKARKLEKHYSYLFQAFIFSIFALFINATYIDVFEASKVAYTFWLMAGIFVGALELQKGEFPEKEPQSKPTKKQEEKKLKT